MTAEHDKSERSQRFERAVRKLEDEGYRRTDMTMSIPKANVEAVLWTCPVAFAVCVAFFLIHRSIFEDLPELAIAFAAAALCLLICIVLHELIHGAVWAVFAPSRFKAVSFGVMWKMLTPYCTCSEPLPRYAYVIGAAAPTILLGIIPCIIALASGSVFWLILGVMMFIGGGGDIAIIARILRYKPKGENPIYIDHPSECGFIVFEKH